jgi:hypothetical protein
MFYPGRQMRNHIHKSIFILKNQVILGHKKSEIFINFSIKISHKINKNYFA